MKTDISACSIHLHKDENHLETRGIWEDVGFKPPQFYMQLIEFLHIKFLNEESVPEYCIKDIIEIIHSPCNNGLFVINDRNRMYSFAKSLGIDVVKADDNHIAAVITWSIISDYVLPDGISFGTEKTISSDK